MTRGFYTLLNLPYEGVVVNEYPTKAEALARFNEDAKHIELNDKGEPTDDSRYDGVALVRIEIIKEKGYWK